MGKRLRPFLCECQNVQQHCPKLNILRPKAAAIMFCEGWVPAFARQHLFYALSFKTLLQSVRMLWGLGPPLVAL